MIRFGSFRSNCDYQVRRLQRMKEMSLLAEFIDLPFACFFNFSPEGIAIDLQAADQDTREIFETTSKFLVGMWFFQQATYNPDRDHTIVLYRLDYRQESRASDEEFGVPILRLIFDGSIEIKKE